MPAYMILIIMLPLNVFMSYSFKLSVHPHVLASAEDFTYTSLGENIFIEGVNDAEDLVKTREALAMLGKNYSNKYDYIQGFATSHTECQTYIFIMVTLCVVQV